MRSYPRSAYPPKARPSNRISSSKLAQCHLALLVLGALAGCGTGDEPVAAPTGLQIEQRCEETLREQQQAECREAANTRCFDCWALCSEAMSQRGDVSCVSSCETICSARACEGPCEATSACVRYRFEVALPAALDEGVFAACSDARQRDQRCSGQPSHLNCAAISRTERAEAAEAYRCWAALPCGKDAILCAEQLAPSDYARRYCERYSALCGAPKECADPQLLDASVFRWYSESTSEGALKCLEQPSCERARGCLQAFDTALLAAP